MSFFIVVICIMNILVKGVMGYTFELNVLSLKRLCTWFIYTSLMFVSVFNHTILDSRKATI
jgi:hypothetical protein